MKPVAEILSFEGCPNRDGAVALVECVCRELGIEVELRLVDVPDPQAAERERFLGSPTIRINGRDVEPGASERNEFVLACRVYRTERGTSGLPAEDLLRAALQQATT
ncbi:MAG TPA: hypothetical protein VH816_15455 [Gaiellaceae bacterium]